MENGKTYCVEDARTDGKLDDCALNLEDYAFVSERDKAQTWLLVKNFVERLRLQRNPCNAFENLLRFNRCDPKIPLHPKNSAIR